MRERTAAILRQQVKKVEESLARSSSPSVFAPQTKSLAYSSIFESVPVTHEDKIGSCDFGYQVLLLRATKRGWRDGSYTHCHYPISAYNGLSLAIATEDT